MRRTVNDPSLPVTPEIQADDLAYLVDAVGGESADVFGSSGGAVAGLAFAAQHPGKVGTLIAHEPPVAELLPDAQHVRAVVDDIEDSCRAYGSGAAWAKFVSLVMHDGPVTDAGVPPAEWPPPGSSREEAESQSGEAANTGETEPEPSEKQQADDELFFLCMLRPFTRYEPPVDVLLSGGPRVVVAVGEASRRSRGRQGAMCRAVRRAGLAVGRPGRRAVL